MPRCNKSRYALLGLLNKRPLSGYDLKCIFNRFSAFHWNESNAQIYPMLKALEKDGLVSSEVDPDSGKRQRRIYAITAAGTDALNAWFLEPVEMPKYREELLLKLSNSQHLPASVMLKHLDDYEFQLNNKRHVLMKQFEHIDSSHGARPDYAVLTLTYDYAQMLLEAKLKWCQHARLRLQQMD